MRSHTERRNMAKKPKRDDKEQSQRFVETAKQLEVDKSGKSFDRALKAVVHKIKKKLP